MSKLTDTQLVVLSAAAARDDGVAIPPSNLNKAAATKVGASLVARKLMREVRAKPGMPVWREGDENRPISLVITALGRKAIGVEDAPEQRIAEQRRADEKKTTSATRAEADSKTQTGAPRAGSKQALVIDMLGAKGGATIDALVDATGWLPHTTRAALTGLRKKGFAITRERRADKRSSYSLALASADAGS